MSPPHVLDRLDDYLDAELSPTGMRMVRAHLALCDVCAAEYREAVALAATVRHHLRRVVVPAGLRARLAVALRELSSSDPH